MTSLSLPEALTCSRREDDLSCRHGFKPPLTSYMYIVRISLLKYVDVISTRASGLSISHSRPECLTDPSERDKRWGIAGVRDGLACWVVDFK